MQKAIESLQADLAATKGMPQTEYMPCSPLSLAKMSVDIQENVAKKRLSIPLFDAKSEPHVLGLPRTSEQILKFHDSNGRYRCNINADPSP